jgi:hypothetical protein
MVAEAWLWACAQRVRVLAVQTSSSAAAVKSRATQLHWKQRCRSVRYATGLQVLESLRSCVDRCTTLDLAWQRGQAKRSPRSGSHHSSTVLDTSSTGTFDSVESRLHRHKKEELSHGMGHAC